MRSARSLRRAATSLVALLALAACGKGEESSQDSAAIAAALPKPYVDGADTAAKAPMGEGDKSFLEQMSDHHAGLIQMAYVTRGKVSDPETRTDADKMHEVQSAERDSMLAILKRDFKESYTPKVMPEHQRMADSLGKMRGRALAKGFYDMTVAHHEDGVAMIDHYLPTLKVAAVKAMAERMKADQQREIAEFRAKAPTKEAADPRKDGTLPE